MFMHQASADPTALEQISLMINKYNQLIVEIKSIEELQNKKNSEIEQLKKEMDSELSELRLKSSELKSLVDSATKLKVNVGREFKQIVKTDTFNRLSRRVDALNYEQKISRDELYRTIEQLERKE